MDDYIRSKKFQNEVSMIFDNQYNFFCKNILTSIATKSSFLIPHKDSLSKEKKDINLNFIYFIDGYDKDIEYSGGTFISKDNNGNKIHEVYYSQNVSGDFYQNVITHNMC